MKIGFCGCSITYGVGVDEFQRYSSIVGEILDAEVINLAENGKGNRDIFTQALTLLQQDCNIVFVQWSAPGRQDFLPQWDRSYSLNNERQRDTLYSKNNNYAKFVDMFKLLDNSYNQYNDFYKHTKILNNFQTPVYYINGLMHIDPIFLSSDGIADLSKLNDYTKELIDFDNLPDIDIRSAIAEIRQWFLPSLDQWVNTSRLARIDVGTDGMHPGPASHAMYANNLVEFIRKKSPLM